jgi:hypothetical protein
MWNKLSRTIPLWLKGGNPLVLFAALILLELASIVIVMAIYMKGERSFPVFLSSNPGLVFLAAVGLLVAAGAVIIYEYLTHARVLARSFGSIVMINLVAVTLPLVTLEITVRTFSVSSSAGDVIFGIVLKPLDWSRVAMHHRELIGGLSYVVHDDVLGWTVSPNKQRADGLYSTDPNGIRSSDSDPGFAKLGGKTRIALVGDSHTFGQELAYEDTWGHVLEKSLGPEFQVLNFGVPGYGVDQAFLRFEREVRRWKPKVVIYGFDSGALSRALIVYTFLSRPNWNLPFSKPRLMLRDGEIKEMNVPALSPETIFSKESIFDLPFLEYDVGYKQSDWQHKPYHFLYLVRLFVSLIPSWSHANPDVSEEALMALNISILRAFVQSAAKSGVIPIVVHLPQPPELETPTKAQVGKRVLEKSGIEYNDLMPCLLQSNPANRLVPSGNHYSGQTNAAIADCLLTVVKETLALQ